MKLWSVQSLSQIRNLFINGVIETDWKFIDKPSRTAYLYMIDRMRRESICINHNAPVWAFHSCYGYQLPPSQQEIELIFPEVEQGSAFMLQLEYKRNDFLLSRYDDWCEKIYHPCFEYGTYENLTHDDSRIFEINDCDEIIQACIPAIYLSDVRIIQLLQQN